jgi:hypothetical protein
MTFSNKNDLLAEGCCRHDRISADVAAALTINLVTEDGAVHAVVPIDVSTSGVCLRLSPEDLLVLDVGQRVSLHIQPRTGEAPVVVQAFVCSIGADDDGNPYSGLEFENLYQIFEDILPTLWKVCHTIHGQL